MRWLIRVNDNEYSASSTDELRRFYLEGRINPQDYVYHPLFERWMYVRDVEELQEELKFQGPRRPPIAEPEQAPSLSSNDLIDDLAPMPVEGRQGEKRSFWKKALIPSIIVGLVLVLTGVKQALDVREQNEKAARAEAALNAKIKAEADAFQRKVDEVARINPDQNLETLGGSCVELGDKLPVQLRPKCASAHARLAEKALEDRSAESAAEMIRFAEKEGLDSAESATLRSEIAAQFVKEGAQCVRSGDLGCAHQKRVAARSLDPEAKGLQSLDASFARAEERARDLARRQAEKEATDRKRREEALRKQREQKLRADLHRNLDGAGGGFVRGWKIKGDSFILIIEPSRYDQNEAYAAAMTARALFEANDVRLPSTLVFQDTSGRYLDSGPFSAVPGVM